MEQSGWRSLIEQRFLEEENSEEEEEAPFNDAAVLRDTFVVYGSVLLVVLIVFCYVRRRYPRPYNLRNWVEEIKSPIAERQYGFFSWMWQLNAITEDELLRECGMDALCVLRLLYMGYRIALVSCFNAIWLIPIYATAPGDNKTDAITDKVQRLTIAHVPAGSARLVATAVAAYILFGYTMYLILQEFEWFIEMRHKYLRMAVPQNYTVYVRNVPDEYKSNAALHEYFAGCFSAKSVLECKLRIKAPELVKQVATRDGLVTKLEHAINIEEVLGKNPTHSKSLAVPGMPKETVDSIPTYASELKEANRAVTEQIEEIEESTILAAEKELTRRQTSGMSSRQFAARSAASTSFRSPESSNGLTPIVEANGATNNMGLSSVHGDADTLVSGLDNDDNYGDNNEDDSKSLSLSARLLKKTSKFAAASSSKAMGAVNIMAIPGKNEFYPAGFVTFSSLRDTNAALQMIHHQTPFSIEALEAPRPGDIFWGNVGRSHKDLQVGNLISTAATSALCLLWTIPMTFIASLSSLEALRRDVAFIDDLVTAVPLIGQILAIIAPMFVKIANAMLPIILEYLSMFEGPVSSSVVVASLFIKLSAFMIIQTFFVSAISGGLLAEINKLIEDPLSIIGILAVSLPSQSTYFIQIVFVGMVISVSLEILRVIPLILAFIRSFLPTKLTEAERSRTVFGMRPLCDPNDFEAADNLAQVVLNFIVMLVYAVIAPLTVFIQAFCFLVLMISYKHQFVYIYPSHPDSGGRIWTNFIKVLLTCMLIGQITVIGLLSLKQAVIGVPLMVPLVIITILFNGYVRQMHFRVAETLPSRECMKVDLVNGPDFDLSFTKDAYMQLEMQKKVVYPENMSKDRADKLGIYSDEKDDNYGATASDGLLGSLPS